MTDWMLWFAITGTLVILEMFTGTFYLLMMAIGFVAGGVAAFAGAGSAVQLVVAAIVGIIATYGLRKSKLGRRAKGDAARDPNVNLDIGQTLVVDAWHGAGDGVRTARVRYRGTLWDVELERGASAAPGEYVIREVRGNRLVVGRKGSHKHNQEERNA